MTKTPKEIAIEVFEKGEDGMTPILTRLEIAASLGIAEGRQECSKEYEALVRNARATLAKELREYGKQYHYKRGERIVLFRFARKIERETAKEATKTK